MTKKLEKLCEEANAGCAVDAFNTVSRYLVPDYWNELPDEVKAAMNALSIKVRVHDQLAEQAEKNKDKIALYLTDAEGQLLKAVLKDWMQYHSADNDEAAQKLLNGLVNQLTSTLDILPYKSTEKRSEHVQLLMKPSVKSMAKEFCEDKGVSMNDYFEWLIKQHLGEAK